jgi:hypothetical protein
MRAHILVLKIFKYQLFRMVRKRRRDIAILFYKFAFEFIYISSGWLL